MKRLILLLIAGWISAVPLWADSGAIAQNYSLNAEVGNNYYGNSIGLSLSRRIVDHLWANLGYENGSFSHFQEAGSTFFIFSNPSSINYNLNIGIHEMTDLFISWRWKEDKPVWFLNSIGIGLSHYNLTVSSSFQKIGYPGIFRGAKDMSGFALYADLHLLDVHLPDDKLSYSLGVKCHTVWLSSPQVIVTDNGLGDTSNAAAEVSSDGGPIVVPYLELFLRVGYVF